MSLAPSGLNFEVCLIYLDDIIVFSTDIETHLERLEMVLQRLTAVGLKLKPTKCNLLREDVRFLQ